MRTNPSFYFTFFDIIQHLYLSQTVINKFVIVTCSINYFYVNVLNHSYILAIFQW